MKIDYEELLDITIGKLRNAERRKKNLEKLNMTKTIEYAEAECDIAYYSEVRVILKAKVERMRTIR